MHVSPRRSRTDGAEKLFRIEIIETRASVSVRVHRIYVGVKTDGKKLPEIRPFCRRIGAIGLLEGFQCIGEHLPCRALSGITREDWINLRRFELSLTVLSGLLSLSLSRPLFYGIATGFLNPSP